MNHLTFSDLELFKCPLGKLSEGGPPLSILLYATTTREEFEALPLPLVSALDFRTLVPPVPLTSLIPGFRFIFVTHGRRNGYHHRFGATSPRTAILRQISSGTVK